MLNRYRVKSSIGGSNPPLSASESFSNSGTFSSSRSRIWRQDREFSYSQRIALDYPLQKCPFSLLGRVEVRFFPGSAMNFCDELARNKDPVPIVGIGCTRALANTGRITILFQGFVSEFAMMRSPRRWAGPCVLISFAQSERELTGERILQKANSRAGQDLVLRFPALQRCSAGNLCSTGGSGKKGA